MLDSACLLLIFKMIHYTEKEVKWEALMGTKWLHVIQAGRWVIIRVKNEPLTRNIYQDTVGAGVENKC